MKLFRFICQIPAYIFLLTIFSILLVACGGGGSGGTNSDQVAVNYTGITTPATLDRQISGEAAADYVAIQAIANSFMNARFNYLSLIHNVSYQEVFTCESGNIDVNVSRGNRISLVTLDYNNCNNAGVVETGHVTYRYEFVDTYTVETIEVVLDSYQLSSGGETVTFGGNINISNTNDYSMTVNLVVQDNNKRQFMVENLILPDSAYISLFTDSSTGRFYYSDKGYLDLTNTQPFEIPYGGMTPTSGGPLLINNNSGAIARLSILNANQAWLELEEDGEIKGVSLHWEQLEVSVIPEDGGFLPVASSGDASNYYYDTTNISSASQVTLDGRFSNDPELDFVSFEWSILATPNESQAYISSTNKPVATLHPDRLGEYTIRLRVFDGVQWSSPHDFIVNLNAVGIHIFPGAQFVQDFPGKKSSAQEYRYTTKPVFLDGSRSTKELDFITLAYNWRLISAPEGSSVSLENDNALIASITPDITGRYEIGLIVNDGLNTSVEAIFIFNARDYEDYFIPTVRLHEQFGFVNSNTLLGASGRFFLSQAVEVNSYSWALVNKPANSQIIFQGADTPAIPFVPDVKGVYTFEVIASNGYESNLPIQFPVYVMDTPSFSSVVLNPIDAFTGTSSRALAVHVGDVDNDNKTDVVMPISTSGLDFANLSYTFLQAPGVDFSIYQENSFIDYLYELGEIVDIDGDLKKEFIASTNNGLNIYQFQNDYTFNVVANIPPGISGIINEDEFSVNDINSDGRSDLIWLKISSTGKSLIIAEQNVTPLTFIVTTAVPLTQDYEWVDLEVIDITNDGRNDIVLLGHKYQHNTPEGTVFDDRAQVIYFPQNADGTLGAQQVWSLDISRFSPVSHASKFTDIDDDGDIDLVAIAKERSNTGINGVGIWLQDDQGNLNYHSILLDGPFRYLANHVDVADMDLDGNLDLVIRTDRGIIIFYQTSAVEFELGQRYKFDYDLYYGIAPIIRNADIDDDGDIDIVLSHKYPELRNLQILQNQAIP